MNFAFWSLPKNRLNGMPTATPRKTRSNKILGSFGTSLELLEERTLLSAVTIQLDYTFDTQNFFNTQAKKDLLQQAADSLASHLADNLTAITPGSGNTWKEVFTNPGTGNTQMLTDQTVPAGTLVVYIGGRPLSGTEAGEGEIGGASASGSQAFVNAVSARGQAGALAQTQTDFGRWGGGITFDSGTNWFFGTTTSGLQSNQTDFVSVATHEMGHVLGFGTAPSFQTRISGSNFIGAQSAAEFGGPVPLDGSQGHWAQAVTDHGIGPAMTPTILNGTRKLFTNLDFAGLADLGWTLQDPPAPPVTITGTSGNDVITFDPGTTTDTVTINGVASTFSTAGVSMITINTGAGNDTINILGNNPGITTIVSSTGTATINVGRSGSIQGVSGTLSVLNSTARGTTLNLDDSADASGRTVTFDTLFVSGTVTGLAPGAIGYDYAGTAAVNVKLGTGNNAEILRAPSSGGATLNVTAAANDVASLVGAGNDVYIGAARYGQLFNTSGYTATITGAATVAAYAAAGGNDQANLDLRADSASTLSGTRGNSFIQGSNYATYAFGFGPVYAYGNAAHVAKLYPGTNDVMVATSTNGYIAGTGYLIQAFGFGNTYAFGGPTNTAQFYPSAGGTFVGNSTMGYVYGAGYVDAAVGFGNVTAVGNSSNTAYLFPGSHDNFVATPDFAYINGSGYADVALGFGTIHAQGDVTNTAYLYLGSNYQFTSKGADSASMKNNAQTQIVSTSGFGTVNAFAKDNTDIASLFDSAGNDLLYGRGSYVGLFSGSFIVATSGFSSVTASSVNGGTDPLDLAQLSGQVTPTGNWI